MRTSSAKVQIVDPNPQQLQLQQLIERFNQAGNRLEERYRTLQVEASELRKALQQKDEELKRNARLAMLGETAAALAHEVRNPLGAMKLFNGLLEREISANPSALELCSQLGNCITALDSVVTNILFFAKDSPLNLVPINLHALISTLVEHNKLIAPEAHFKCELGAENPFVLGVEQSLRQVFDNLLRNSIDAAVPDVVICIETQLRGDGAMQVRIHDNGPGIPQDILTRIFEPFVTSRPEGTGLGLAVVRRILEQHNATISAQNINGAAFEIVFLNKSKS